MKLPLCALSLFLVAFVPAAAAKERRIRGNALAEALRPPRGGRQGGLQAPVRDGIPTLPDDANSAFGAEGIGQFSDGGCTLGAVSYLQIPGEEDVGPERLGCVAESGAFTPIDADASQVEAVLGLAASGEVSFSETQVELGYGIQATRDGHIQVAPNHVIRPTGRQGANPEGGPMTRDEVSPRVSERPGRRLSPGPRYFVVFRVTDSNGLVNPHSAVTMSDNIFGTSGDAVNLVSQLDACSNGAYTALPGVRPGYDLGDIMAAPGVVEITIGVPHNGEYEPARAAAQAKLDLHFGSSAVMTTYLDHAMFVLPEGNYGGWAGYAAVGGWYQVYQGIYYAYPGVLLHEHGHNMQLAHSGGLDGEAYTDHTGLMGNPLWGDDLGMMCFNPAKNW